MHTPWGEIPVSDSHIHFFSHGFFHLLTGGRSVPETTSFLGWTTPPENGGDLAANWIAELDKHGVESAKLIASMPGDTSILAAIERFPARLHGAFLFNPLAQHADALAGLLAAGLKTICLFPAMHRYGANDASIRFVFDQAAVMRANVFVHCGVLSVGVRKKLGLPSLFDMRYSNPIDLHAVALAYPSVRFIVPHFGAGYFREALMLADLCPNVYLDTSSSNSWMKYQSGDLDLAQVFRKALDVAGARRLLFGTDSSFFPRGWHAAVFEAQCAALVQVGIGAPDARRIFHGNLAEITS